MHMHHIQRFLYESALHLELDPALALRDLCARRPRAGRRAGRDDGRDWLQSLCDRPPTVFEHSHCNA